MNWWKWTGVVVLGLLVAVSGAWVLGADIPVVGTRAPELTGTMWRLVAFEVDGQRWEVPPAVDTEVRFEQRSFASHVCNWQEGDLTIHRSTLDTGTWLSTAKGCHGDEARAEALYSRVMREPAWSVADGVLRLAGDGVTAELRPRG